MNEITDESDVVQTIFDKYTFYIFNKDRELV